MTTEQLISQYDGTHVKVGNRHVRVDKGAAVPPGAQEEHVRVLLQRGMLAEGEPTAGFVDSATVPPFPGRGAHESDESDDDADGDGPIPPKSADKATWVAYAVTQGVTEDDANALTKDQLIEQYGTKPAS